MFADAVESPGAMCLAA